MFRVRRAATMGEFRAAPLGSCVTGRVWIFYSPHRDFTGYTVWGRPTGDDFARLAQALDTVRDAKTGPRAFLIDLKSMGVPDTAAFDAAVRYTIEHHESLGRAIVRLAIVRSEGIAGALIAGFFRVVPRYCPVEVFTDAAEAMRWLGRSEDLAVLEEVEAIRTELLGASSFIGDLGSYLDATPRATLTTAARRFGLSERSFQRRLGEMRTTFSNELMRARVRAGEKLLAESDLPVSTIAFEVGCASPQHFATLFRKLSGLTPSAWRHRKARSSA